MSGNCDSGNHVIRVLGVFQPQSFYSCNNSENYLILFLIDYADYFLSVVQIDVAFEKCYQGTYLYVTHVKPISSLVQ